MFNLPNKCFRTKVSIYPQDWKDPGADISIDWYLHYRFTDPIFIRRYPEGKLCIVKKGINTAKTLVARRERIKRYKENLEHRLSEGFNPITGALIPPGEVAITPEPTFVPPVEPVEQSSSAVVELIPKPLLSYSHSIISLPITPETIKIAMEDITFSVNK